MKKIYIAGPMRGLPHWNFPAFDEAEARWKSIGWQVFSPASVARALGYDPPRNGDPLAADDAHLRHVLLSDINCVMAADAIGLLPGWERSTGATVELAVAQFLSLPVYDAVTGKPMTPVCHPWSH